MGAVLAAGVEFGAHNLGNVYANCRFSLLEEDGCVLHQSAQHGLLRATAVVGGRGTVRLPLRLPANGLQALR